MLARTVARSYLFAPADNELLLEKVFSAGADAVVLDLEDAVLPSGKARARLLLANALKQRAVSSMPIFVRINPVSSGSDWQADIEAAVAPSTAGIRLAKAGSQSEINFVDQALSSAERRLGIVPGSVSIVPTIETAEGLLKSAEMATCPRVTGFCFGASDFLNDISGELDQAATALNYAQSYLVLVSKSAGLLAPIASVHTDISDIQGLKRTTEQFRRMGFFGRSCIHPSQLAVVHEVFTPTPEQIKEARTVIETYENAAAGGSGVSKTSAHHFVDESVVARARKTLSLATQFSRRVDKS